MSGTATAKNVLHIGKYFPPHVGGMEAYLHNLMHALAALKINPCALVHQSKISLTSVEESFSENGSKLLIVRAATWGRLLFTPISPSFPWVLHRLIKRNQPDLLHLHLPNPSAFWALALPSARRLPWVIHWQSDVRTQRSHWLLKLAYGIYSPFESALLKKADKVIVSSPPYLATSQPLAKISDKCAVIPLGIEDRFGAQTRNDSTVVPASAGEASAETAGNLNVLAIGRMTHYKGFDILLRAIAQTEGITLDLVGHGELTQSLEHLKDSLNLSARVRFHGLLDDNAKDKLLSRCDCLCLPSTDRTESFGMVLLEAMSAAKACVVSDVEGSGMSWLVEDGETGLVTPTKDVDCLTNALCRLRDDPALVIRLGLKGRQKFLRTLTIDASAKAIQDLYHHLPSPR
jgi:glycosyltransferase involved in cell wall biosynthesis